MARCSKCVYRRNIPGDCHSLCNAPCEVSVVGATVELNPYGVANGWASWPWNFDPIWINKCSLFKQKEDKTNAGTPND